MSKHQVFIIEWDLNDTTLLTKLFNIVSLTHVLHIAAQVGVQYAMQTSQSYVKSNIVGFVNLLKIDKVANPQLLIFWSSLSYVYELNIENPFFECDKIDHSTSLYATEKKTGEESFILITISMTFSSMDSTVDRLGFIKLCL